jgi:hypothetical protein
MKFKLKKEKKNKYNIVYKEKKISLFYIACLILFYTEKN